VTNPRIRVITCRAQGNGNTKVSPLSNAQRSGKLSNVLSVLALTGASTGTLLDGIHSRVHLLVYDSAPFIIGGLHTSAWVPPLLASLYCVLGGIVLYADYRLAPSDSTTQKAMKHASLSRMAISFAALAAMLELSAVLYTNNVGSSSICVVLAACASLNYLIFDSTKQGLALAVLCALGAPAVPVKIDLLHDLLPHALVLRQAMT